MSTTTGLAPSRHMVHAARHSHRLLTQRVPVSKPLSRLCRARGARVQIVAAQSGDLSSVVRNAGVAFVISFALASGQPALADLNKYEAAAGGEFGIGSAQQYGEAELRGHDFSNQDLRRANFTSADCRDCNFKGAKLQGSYFIKAVVPRANFTDADLSDVLMDRAVMNEADLSNTILQRAIFTRSDLTGAKITGADFTNALVDRVQQTALCRYADGTNPVTGTDTRRSLGCGSRRRFRESSPSSPEGPQVADEEKAAFTGTIPKYRQ